MLRNAGPHRLCATKSGSLMTIWKSAIACGASEDLVQIYVPMAQHLVDDIYFVVRPTSGRAEGLTPSVRAAIGRVDKEQLVSVRDVMTLEEVA